MPSDLAATSVPRSVVQRSGEPRLSSFGTLAWADDSLADERTFALSQGAEGLSRGNRK